MNAHEEHFCLIDAVNDAKTHASRDVAAARLDGWRRGVEVCDHRWDCCDADFHSMGRFGDRPMCCGVLLDWEPA